MADFHPLDKVVWEPTPPAVKPQLETGEDCGVRITTSPAIKNAPLPADGPGGEHFSNTVLFALLATTPLALSWLLGGGWLLTATLGLIASIPILIAYWTYRSACSPRLNERVKLPGRPVEFYVTFKNPKDKKRYSGSNKIPLETFAEMYFRDDVEFNGDALDVLEYRHDWATFKFTPSIFRYLFFSFFPEVLLHTRSQDEEQVRDHYDRGDDFYAWFLGPRMVYTSGIISEWWREETLEEMQDNKLAVVCEKINIKKGESLLDIGCGWGALAVFASVNYGARVTGVTLGRNQTAWGNRWLQKVGVPREQSRIECMDYRDIPDGKYDKITCLEMAEHVGIRKITAFFKRVYDLLEDDGVFHLQIAGFRKPWQFDDLVWGLFMSKYVFPGADASTPLTWYVHFVESAGFEVKSIDTIGIHYSGTIWRWYRNWLGNAANVRAKYGDRWYRIWEYFLATATIYSRQGSATCYQITLAKNINSVHRVDGIWSQYNLAGALQASKRAGKAGMTPEEYGVGSVNDSSPDALSAMERK
ncbi:putative cyclopropane-fatty-acyl-phospholipid synthase [Coniochaeta sp. 2T2.1]|nr:putative cyclopropane-fatty-acyl-phospholipid synthase [Coniochaeta sp. 2T2.1]